MHDPAAGPIRSCIGCRRRRPALELTPLGLSGHGELVIGQRGSGRGAWICADSDCFEAAGRTKGFSRGFRRKLADAVLADTLLGWLAETAH